MVRRPSLAGQSCGTKPQLSIPPYGSSSPAGSVRTHPGARSTSLGSYAALERAVRKTVPKPLALVPELPSNQRRQSRRSRVMPRHRDFCNGHHIWIMRDIELPRSSRRHPAAVGTCRCRGARDIAVELPRINPYSYGGWR